VVETPEQIRIEFALAGIGSRFLAFALDFAIQFGVGLVLLIVWAVISVSGYRSVWLIAIVISSLFLLHFGYFIGFEILWNGQTPGKRKAGLRVIKDSGRPLSPFETVARNLLRIVDQLPGFYAVGLIAIVSTKSNKRLGDLVAGSIVVREGSLSELPPVWHAAPIVASANPAGAGLLSPEEIALVNTFLARRDQLDPQTRQRLADQIISRFSAKLSLTPEKRFAAESTLETLAWESRSRG